MDSDTHKPLQIAASVTGRTLAEAASASPSAVSSRQGDLLDLLEDPSETSGTSLSTATPAAPAATNGHGDDGTALSAKRKALPPANSRPSDSLEVGARGGPFEAARAVERRERAYRAHRAEVYAVVNGFKIHLTLARTVRAACRNAAPESAQQLAKEAFEATGTVTRELLERFGGGRLQAELPLFKKLARIASEMVAGEISFNRNSDDPLGRLRDGHAIRDIVDTLCSMVQGVVDDDQDLVPRPGNVEVALIGIAAAAQPLMALSDNLDLFGNVTLGDLVLAAQPSIQTATARIIRHLTGLVGEPNRQDPLLFRCAAGAACEVWSETAKHGFNSLRNNRASRFYQLPAPGPRVVAFMARTEEMCLALIEEVISFDPLGASRTMLAEDWGPCPVAG